MILRFQESRSSSPVTQSAMLKLVLTHTEELTRVEYWSRPFLSIGTSSCPVMFLTRIPHLAQTSDAVNRQLSCFSSRYMNLLAVFQI